MTRFGQIAFAVLFARDAVFLFKGETEFQGVDGIEPQAFVKKRGIGFNVRRRDVFEVERFNDERLQFFNKCSVTHDDGRS